MIGVYTDGRREVLCLEISTSEAASAQWRAVADQIRSKVPKLTAPMDDVEHGVLTCNSFPKKHRAKQHGTNQIQRLNGEIKRRTDVVGIFPNDETIAPMGDDPAISLPAVASRSSGPAPRIAVTISAG